MKATEEVGKSVFSVVFEEVFDEREIKSDFEWEKVFGAKVHFDILSEGTGND